MQQEFDELCASYGFNGETLVKRIRYAFEQFLEAWEKVRELAEEFREYLLFHKENQRKRRQQNKLDFTRPIIRHQVIERKPKHLIKKII